MILQIAAGFFCPIETFHPSFAGEKCIGLVQLNGKENNHTKGKNNTFVI
ncbi:hypothetical protein [Enterococcus florum]|nr:hypothetical protein [Enterococcus florum]